MKWEHAFVNSALTKDSFGQREGCPQRGQPCDELPSHLRLESFLQKRQRRLNCRSLCIIVIKVRKVINSLFKAINKR